MSIWPLSAPAARLPGVPLVVTLRYDAHPPLGVDVTAVVGAAMLSPASPVFLSHVWPVAVWFGTKTPGVKVNELVGS